MFNFSVDQFFGQILSLARSRMVHDSIANRADGRFLLLKCRFARIAAGKKKRRDDEYRKDRFQLRRKPVQLALRTRAGSDDDAISGDTNNFDRGSMIDVSSIADNIEVPVAEHGLSGWTQS